MKMIDLREYLFSLDTDLWSMGRKKRLEGIVVQLIHTGNELLPRELFRKDRNLDNTYYYTVLGMDGNVKRWLIHRNYWEVVNVSRKRYHGGIKTLITATRVGSA
jgi:hypothetical protein